MPKKKEFDPTKVLEVKLSELHPFKNHPFKVLDDDLMQQTVDLLFYASYAGFQNYLSDPWCIHKPSFLSFYH